MASNIEIKARARDFPTQQNAARRLSGDQDGTILEQEDIFFEVPDGRLKLRLLGPQQGELIYYQRANQAGPRPSNYLIVRTNDPDALKAVLEAALPVVGSVRKRRTLYLVGQTRIHLDAVENLGQFIELEYVLQPNESANNGQKTVQNLMAELGIQPQDLLAEAYLDLLLAQSETRSHMRRKPGKDEATANQDRKAQPEANDRSSQKPWVRYWDHLRDEYDGAFHFAAGNDVLVQMHTTLCQEEPLGNVLELGCGSGIFTQTLSEKAAQVTATDLSLPLLAVAQRKLRRVEHVAFAAMDSEKIEFPDASFDTVFMANLITIVDAKKTLSECRRVLKPGGRLLIMNIVARRITWAERLRLVLRTISMFGIPPLGRKDYSAEKLAALVAEAGFRVLSARLLGQQVKFLYVRGRKP
jgi:predicted adenylyl cyclase CyaB